MYAVKWGYPFKMICRLLDRITRILSKKMPPVKLTTLTHPQEQMGRDATDWMIKNIQGKKNLPDQTFYEPELIPGETIKQLNARKK